MPAHSDAQPPRYPQPVPIRREPVETPETRLEEAALLAERALLASVLCDPPAVAAVRETVEPTDFLAPAHAQVYRCMVGLLKRGTPPDFPAVCAAVALQKDPLTTAAGLSALLVQALEAPGCYPAYAEHYAERVREFAERRRAQERARQEYRRSLSADFAPPPPLGRTRRYLTDRPDN